MKASSSHERIYLIEIVIIYKIKIPLFVLFSFSIVAMLLSPIIVKCLRSEVFKLSEVWPLVALIVFQHNRELCADCRLEKYT